MAKLFNDESSKISVLNEKAFRIFEHCAKMAKENGGYIKIDNTDGYIPLSVEILQTSEWALFTAHKVAMAHYGEQNGDLMADPDMVFIWCESKINEEDNFAMPCSYQNDYCAYYQESMEYDENLNPTSVRPKLQEEHVDFCDMWMANISDQQNLGFELPIAI